MKTLPSFGFALLLLALASTSCQKMAPSEQPVTLTILHTNDTHSQVEPLSPGGPKGNKGGYARRMGYIEQERSNDPALLLVDAGDFSQGTPYFNFYNGRIEMEALNRMGYDAITLGNHEFDNGVDTLATILAMAEFPIVCANYQVEGTPLEGLVKPFVVLERKNVRIGLFGLGVQPVGLIAPQNFAPLVWEDPLPIANQVAAQLKQKEHCDVVICLSHLGTEAEANDTLCDTYLAAHSHNIDLIIGGHTHKVVEQKEVTDLDGKPVLLTQAGKSGLFIGKIMLSLQQ